MQWHYSMKQGSEWSNLLPTLAQLYVGGTDVNWAGFFRPLAGQKVILPTYAFDRQRY